MKLTRREKVLLCILIAILAGAGYYYFFWTSWSARDAALSGEINRVSSEIRDEKSRLLLLPAVRGEVARLEERRDELMTGVPELPEKGEIAELFSRIMPTGATYTLTLDRTPGDYAVIVTASVTAAGPPDTARLLLARLESGDMPCAVRSADMSALPSGESIALVVDFLYLKT